MNHFTTVKRSSLWGFRTPIWHAGVLVAGGSTIVGLLLATIGPIFTAITVIAFVGGVWTIASLKNSLLALTAIVLLLPYATMPFKVVLTPSFLDLAMVAVYGLYALQWMTGERRRLTTTPVHLIIILFVILCLFSFIAGLRNAGLTSNKLRQFAELMLAIGLGFILIDVLQTPAEIQQFIHTVVSLGAASALVGIVLWILPASITESALARLSVIGYPSSGIVRYVEENPDLPERAIGTSTDPNAFGGLMVMVGSLAAAKAFETNQRVWIRVGNVALFATILIAVVLTFSRGSMLALGSSIVFISLLKDRRLIFLVILGAVIFFLLPWTQPYVQRFTEGFQGADLATQMRFGEYKDALILISRYPFLGVGFTGTPDIDIYLGVANLYLTVASNMGILGLVAFLVMFSSFFIYGLQARIHLGSLPDLRAIWLGLIASLVGVLVSGIFDHFFFNLEFFHISTMMWMLIGCMLATTNVILRGVQKESNVLSP